MIHYPPVGPLWGSERAARAEILRDTSGEYPNRRTPGATNDSNSSCRPSLGLGNTVGAEILEGDVWKALKIKHAVRQL